MRHMFSTFKRLYDKMYDILTYYSEGILSSNPDFYKDGIMIWTAPNTDRVIQIIIFDYKKRTDNAKENGCEASALDANSFLKSKQSE